tara:strand:+ start:249 stop:749 length:501 start_codon:yes stop_codon:yes gene_type:complete
MGTLTLSITENINVSSGGFEYNYTTSGTSDDLNIEDVDAFTDTTLSIGTAFTQVAKFSSGATVGMGLYDSAKFKYMRFRNTDGSNFVTLQLSDAATNKQVNYKILPGEAAYFTSLVFDNNASTTVAATDVVQGTSNVAGLTATADEVQLKANSSACAVDILIAYDL